MIELLNGRSPLDPYLFLSEYALDKGKELPPDLFNQASLVPSIIQEVINNIIEEYKALYNIVELTRDNKLIKFM